MHSSTDDDFDDDHSHIHALRGSANYSITFSFAAGGYLQAYLFGAAHAITQCLPKDCRVHGLLDAEAPPGFLFHRADDNDDDTKRNQPDENGTGDGGATVSPGSTNEEDTAATSLNRTRPVIKFAGSSAGALASIAVLCGADLLKMLEHTTSKIVWVRSSLWNCLQIKNLIAEGVQTFAVDIFLNCGGRGGRRGGDGNNNNSPGESDPTSGFSSFSPLPSSAASRPPAPSSPTTMEPLSTPSEAGSPSSSFEEEISPASQQQHDRGGWSGGWSGGTYVFPRHVKEQVNDRLEVYATSLPFLKPVVFGNSNTNNSNSDSQEHCRGDINNYVAVEIKSTADLEEALVASCCLVPFCLPFRLRHTGDWVVDGGLRNFQPKKGDPGVVLVSPMYFSAADVKPSVFVPSWWGIYPPSEKQYRALFALGNNDMVKFLQRAKLVPEHDESSSFPFAKFLLPCDESCLSSSFSANSRFVFDVVIGALFIGAVRPLGMLLVYAELCFVSFLCFFATVFHELFPHAFAWLIGTKSLRNRRGGGRAEAARDWWAVLRNLLSPRTWLHLGFGNRDTNTRRRIARYSRMYRVLYPNRAAGVSDEKKLDE